MRGYLGLLVLLALCVGGLFGFHLMFGMHRATAWAAPSIRPGHVALYLCASGTTQSDAACHPVGLASVHGLAELKVLASQHYACTAVATDATDANTAANTAANRVCRLFDENGLEITQENQLATLANGTHLAVVNGDNHFFWPTVRIGHRWQPKHVVSPIPNKPIEMETLSDSPRVFLLDNFITDEEINYLVEHAKNRLERSHVGIGKEHFHNQRTSKTAWDTGSTISMKIQHRAYDLVRMPYYKR